MDNQKGQSTVEFAFVLPLFLMIMFAAIYGGMMFYDFWNVKSVTENMARDAMFKVDETTNEITEKNKIVDPAKEKVKKLTAYKLKTIDLDLTEKKDAVVAKITLEKKDDIPSIVSSLLPEEMPFESKMPVINSQ